MRPPPSAWEAAHSFVGPDNRGAGATSPLRSSRPTAGSSPYATSARDLQVDPPNVPFRAGHRAEAWGSQCPGPVPEALPASYPGPSAPGLGPQGSMGPRRERPGTRRRNPNSQAGTSRASRAPEVASAQLPPREPGGGASYGYAVQSECNTRGFGGAGAAPPLGWGIRPIATFDEGSRGVRASLGQSGASEPEPP